MGKYIRKAKISGEVAVMEVSHQSSLGVRTRARTLAAASALQKPTAAPSNDSSLAYLELRSRRLEKPLPTPPAASKSPPKKPAGKKPASPNPKLSQMIESVSTRRCSKKDEGAAPDVEVSCGENVLEAEARERYVRETTPCSLIRDSETIRTPGSTTKPSNLTAANRRMQSSVRRNIPTSLEMEEFFAGAEQLQQRIFMEKYNFDPVNEDPLPGRYEWVRLNF